MENFPPCYVCGCTERHPHQWVGGARECVRCGNVATPQDDVAVAAAAAAATCHEEKEAEEKK